MMTGYERQLKYFDLLIKNNSLGHAFLFYGPDIPAQKQIAQAVIFRVNRPDSNRSDFLDQDQLARSLKNESHPDVFMVKKQEDKKEIGIGQIRALKNFVYRTPLNLSVKAVIIEEAHLLSEESWNALLKVLEEPAQHTILFLISSGQNSIPKTILSRVNSVPFLSPQMVEAVNFNAENDIIVNKLIKEQYQSLAEKFEAVEKIISSENALKLLDAWMIFFRNQLLKNTTHQPRIISNIQAILKAKNMIVTTNVNARLVLENLVLTIL